MPRRLKTSLNPLDSENSLTQRQRNLLFSVIKEYCDTGLAVGSKEIRDKYGFDFSPATIRNEFSALRDSGFLFQPFTNASSKPTERAFKLFIDQLIAGLQITNKQQQDLKKRLIDMENQQANLSNEITRLLAFQGGGVGFSVSKDNENFSGISNLLNTPSEGKVGELLDFLDNFDKYKQPLLEATNEAKNTLTVVDSNNSKKSNKKRIKTIFGEDNPILPLGKGYALVATEIYVNGNKTVVGLIAATHLVARKKNLELVDGLSHLLGDNQ